MAEQIRIPVIFEEDTSGLDKSTAALKNVSKAQDEFNNAQAEAVNSLMSESLSDTALKLEAVAQAQSKLNKVNKLDATILISKKGSYNALNAEIELAKIRLDQMTLKQRTNSKEGKKLEEQVKKNTAELKKFTELNKQLDTVLTSTGENLGVMKKRLLELRGISFAGKSKEEISAINSQIGQLADNIADLKAVQNEFGNEFGSQLAGSLQVVTAGVQGVVGVLNILGVKNEALEGLQKNILDLIAVTQSLGAIEDALARGTLSATAARIASTAATIQDSIVKGLNTLQTVAATRAEAARAVITGKASLAVKAAAAVQYIWNAALAANPIGIVVVAIAALVVGVTALAVSLRSGTSEADRLTAALGALQRLGNENSKFREFQLKIAQELGIADTDRTKLEQKQAAERIREIENEIATLEKLRKTKVNAAGAGAIERGLREKEKEQLKELQQEKADIANQELLLKLRLDAQLADGAKKQLDSEVLSIEKLNAKQEERRKKIEQLRKEYAALSEQLRKDSITSGLDFLEAFERLEVEQQLAVEGVKKFEEDVRGAARKANKKLTDEQVGQIELLYDNLIKSFDKKRDDLIKSLANQSNSIRAAVTAAFDGGQGGDINPLQNIFDANAEKDIKERGERIANTIVEVGVDAKRRFGEIFKGGILNGILDLFNIPDKEKEIIKQQLEQGISDVFDGLSSLNDAAISQQNKVVDEKRKQVDELRGLLDEELQLKKDGYANNSDLLAEQLATQTELLRIEEEKRLALEKKASKLRLRQNALELASNIALSIAKAIDANAKFGLVGIVTAAAQIAGIFALIAKGKAQAAAFAKPELRKGAKLKGQSHERGGTPIMMNGQHAYTAERGEWLIGTQPSAEHDGFLERLNNNEFSGDNLNKQIDFSRAFFDDPTAMIADLAPKYGIPLMPDIVGEILPTIRKSVLAGQIAKQEYEKALMVDVMSRHFGQMEGGLTRIERAIEGIPQLVPITEAGYIEKRKRGNTTSIAIFDPPKRRNKA